MLFLRRSLAFLQPQRDGWLVADLRRSEVLHRTGVDEAGCNLPCFPFRRECPEGFAVQIYQSFADDRFFFAVTALYVHHHGHGNPAGYPLIRRGGEVPHARYIARKARCDEHEGAEPKAVTVVGVEV